MSMPPFLDALNELYPGGSESFTHNVVFPLVSIEDVVLLLGTTTHGIRERFIQWKISRSLGDAPEFRSKTISRMLWKIHR